MQIAVYAGLILLGVLIAALLLVGLLDVVRGTPIHAVGTPGDPTACPAIDDPFFREAVELLTHVKLAPGHHVEIFINGDQTYGRLWTDLRAAKSSITMQMYYCNKGKMADELHRILEERADGKIGYTGGFGIDDKWYGNGRQQDQWRDSNVRFTGPAVRQLQATFVVCWAEARGRLLTGRELFPAPEPASTDGMLAAILHASPTIGSTSAERFFVLSIASARERLYISNSYFVPDKAFRQLMCDAVKRGVDVRVLTTSKNTDVKSTWYAGRARYDELFKGGVRIFEYQPAMMHAKTIVVDGGWMSVGSMNADNRSMSFNEESNLVVLDRGAGSSMERLFLEDLEYAAEIRPEEFARRPWTAKIAEHACHLVWRVL